jgi:hypothetical protein
MGTHLVVVNSAKAAKELFDKRSALYSDRPVFVHRHFTSISYDFPDLALPHSKLTCAF